ncbi:MAG: nitrate reductase [bacterium]|nr:nitrate reductase [bacterium]
MTSRWRKNADALAKLVRNHEGPLTQELVRKPGRFGLGQVPSRLAPDAVARSVCGFCSTGCGLKLHLRDGVACNVSPDPDYPVNRGMACPKGWEVLSPLDADDRATQPLVRTDDGSLAPTTWPEAMRHFTEGVRGVQQAHGDAAFAFLGTGQMPTEELAFLGALSKFGLGMVHGDGNTRQCMATAVVSYKESFGFDAPPYSYQDFEDSDVLVLVGSNLCIAHPILWERICRNPHDPRIIVVDPRRTETAEAATQHVPLRPKSDLVLFYGLAKALIERGCVDEAFVAAHTTGFEAFADFVAAFDEDRVLAETGIDASAFARLVDTIAEGERVSFWWTMGVNQSHEGVRVAQSLIDLALLTGNIGRPGTGANSITGQCNAMGSRLFSNTTNLLGGRDFTCETDRADVARLLDIPVERIPSERSLAYDEILEAVREGRIRGLWIVATNSAHSWIDQNDFRELREKLDFLVVQDMYASTETAEMADLVLPAAGWGEKDGTFINSERRVGRIRKVRRAPGEALADFQIFRLVANAAGCDDLFERWKTPEDVFDLMRTLSRGRPCDISGIEGYRMLEESGGMQWPVPESATVDGAMPEQERRLFADGRFFHEDGRARFIFEAPRAVAEPTDEAFPLVLLTGRGSSAQWHTETRTGKSPTLRKLAPAESQLEIHPDDASRAGIATGDRVAVASRRDRLVVRARVTTVVPRGSVFLAMHDARTNRLTHASFDPYSHQPSYKHAAVCIEPATAVD